MRAHGASIEGPFGTLDQARNAVASNDRIDAAVLDLALYDDRTDEIADRLDERGIPFVFTTGYDRSILPWRHRDVPHFNQPCDLRGLVLTLADLSS